MVLWRRRGKLNGKLEVMKLIRTIAIIGTIGFSLVGNPVWAGDAPGTGSPPVVVVEQGKDPGKILGNLKGLVQKFQSERDAYLAQQNQLQAKLNNATTPGQREAIRNQLQKNRDEFLADLKSYREDLKEMVSQLKGKLNNAELKRLIDAAKNSGDGTPPGPALATAAFREFYNRKMRFG